MAITDIAGFLTGQSSKRPDPMGRGINSEQQRLAFGAQRAEGLQRGVRGMMGGDTNTPAEQLQIAMASLDLSKPEDLRKLAGIQQATGDLAGAAQTASKITAMQQAKIAATYAANQEARSALASEQKTESFKLGKVDRLKQETKDAALLTRQIAQQTRQEKTLNLQEEAGAREKLRLNEAMDEKEEAKAAETTLRDVYVKQAQEEGKDNLAAAIKDGLPLSSVPALLYRTSTAKVVSPKGDEKRAYTEILQSPTMQAQITDVLDDERFWSYGTWRLGSLTDEQEEAIFYKTKEISQTQQIPVEEAMVKAIEAMTALATAPPTQAQIAQTAKVAAQAASLNTGSVAPDGSTDAFAGTVKTGSIK